jgi:hypothetical protein
MYSIVKHPLWEPQLVEMWIPFIDGEGMHPDRPIVIEDPDPEEIIFFVYDFYSHWTNHTFFVRLKNQKFESRDFHYMVKHWNRLVCMYFEQESHPSSFYWEDWRIREWISFPSYKGKQSYACIENGFEQKYWLSEEKMLKYFPAFMIWEHLYLRNK